jgi:sugar phosphate isomerase/epimerase
MNTQPARTFGVDLITFYSPDFWHVADRQAISRFAESAPEAFWGTLLDSVASSGVTGIELTFPPGDWRNAVSAFGSAQGFGRELDRRGLHVVSGFFTGFSRARDLFDPVEQAELFEEAVAYAEFLKANGSHLLVAGLPMRTSWDAKPPFIVDMEYASRLAGVLNRLGAVLLREGVRLLLHTEARSVFWTRRDVDLFMLLTDPMYVWFCPDTGHLRMGGSDPTQASLPHSDRIALAHWKDAVGTAPRDVPIDATVHAENRKYFRRVGAGCVDWPAWNQLMHDLGHSDITLLEIDAVPDPVGEITKAREFIDTALVPLYADNH